jgi:hypothetical protein
MRGVTASTMRRRRQGGQQESSGRKVIMRREFTWSGPQARGQRACLTKHTFFLGPLRWWHQPVEDYVVATLQDSLSPHYRIPLPLPVVLFPRTVTSHRHVSVDVKGRQVVGALLVLRHRLQLPRSLSGRGSAPHAARHHTQHGGGADTLMVERDEGCREQSMV